MKTVRVIMSKNVVTASLHDDAVGILKKFTKLNACAVVITEMSRPVGIITRGDMVIKQAAAVFSGKIRNIDILGRFGGDEFMIISPFSSPDSAIFLAERMRSAIAENVFTYNGARIYVTVSIGIAAWSKDIKTPQEIIGLADSCMYEAKRSGKNRVSSSCPDVYINKHV
jgi:predicted signal transduction protein with EAL and GGDEF domain